MAKRIEFAETGGPEVLRMQEFEPEALGPRDVRVTNWAIGLNFIDIYVRTGLYPVSELPSGLGTEGAGVIEAVGEEVKEFREGDRVAYATGPLGAYATHHTLPADKVVMLPDSVSSVCSTWSSIAGRTDMNTEGRTQTAPTSSDNSAKTVRSMSASMKSMACCASASSACTL